MSELSRRELVKAGAATALAAPAFTSSRRDSSLITPPLKPKLI